MARMRTQALVITVALGVLAASPGCKKTREEMIQEAEDKGRELTEKKAGIVKGVGDGLQGEGKKASESVAKGASGVLKSGMQGAKAGFVELSVTASEQLASAGIKVERASIVNDPKETDPGKRNRLVTAYLVLDKPFKGKITMIAKDSAGKELGRAKADVDEDEATGKNFLFAFLDPFADLELATQVELR